MKDEDVPDDMITMGDQDDLDVAIQSAKSLAKRQRLDVGKMEVSSTLEPGFGCCLGDYTPLFPFWRAAILVRRVV
jgi:hypothetical protein